MNARCSKLFQRCEACQQTYCRLRWLLPSTLLSTTRIHHLSCTRQGGLSRTRSKAGKEDSINNSCINSIGNIHQGHARVDDTKACEQTWRNQTSTYHRKYSYSFPSSCVRPTNEKQWRQHTKPWHVTYVTLYLYPGSILGNRNAAQPLACLVCLCSWHHTVFSTRRHPASKPSVRTWFFILEKQAVVTNCETGSVIYVLSQMAEPTGGTTRQFAGTRSITSWTPK